MDRVRMENIIDRLELDEIHDAIGLLQIFERIGQITPQESTELRRRVEARAKSLRGHPPGLRAVMN